MKSILVSILLAVSAASACWAHAGHHHHGGASQGLETRLDPALLGFSGLQEGFNVHPAFVHFPIALFPAALLFYGLGLLFKKGSLRSAGRGCLYLATASSVVAVVTGLFAEDSFPHNEIIHHMMQTHKTIGLVLLAVSLILSIWSFRQTDHRPEAEPLFLAVLAAAVFITLQNGDLGSRMVYSQGAAVKPDVPSITEHEEEADAHHDSHEEHEEHHHDEQ
jgi:uncharacterized membrane protein